MILQEEINQADDKLRSGHDGVFVPADLWRQVSATLKVHQAAVDGGLTRAEHRLLMSLMTGEWHDREAVVQACTGHRHGSESLAATHILRMRRKIEPLGFAIENQPSVGWRLIWPGESGAASD